MSDINKESQISENQKSWPKAVIMDLDGTLIDSVPDITMGLNGAFVDAGFEPFSIDEVRYMIGGGVPKLVERAFDARSLPHDDKMAEVIAGVMKHYSAKPADNTLIYDGVELTLKRLREEGVKVGLCTNKPHSITLKVLDKLGMTTYFDVIVGGTDDTPRKPDPLTLQMCVDQLGLEVDDCLLVGDSGADKGAAEALGMAVYLVEYGYCKTPVAEMKPDATLTEMPDLLKLLFPLDEVTRSF